MKTTLDGLTLTLLAALGLEFGALGCVGPSQADGSETDTATSTATDTSATGTAETETETGEVPYDCQDPVPIMQLDTDTPSGFYECADGFIHRGEAVTCVDPTGPGDSPDCAEWQQLTCETGADCTDKPYGNCNNYGGDGTECSCKYGCATDDDCNEGYICACAGVTRSYASCIPASCITSDGCTDGLCGLNEYYDGCDGSRTMTCTGPDDTCHVAADCELQPCNEGGEPVTTECTAYNGEPYTCRPADCGTICGRPFMIDGSPRTAGAVGRVDWRAAISSVDVDELDDATREQLAAHWTRIGTYEHASIASFARAAMDLLALAAPPSLLLATREALTDEIEHARLAFALASAYADAPIGPGPLATGGALASHADAREIIEGLIVEACVGETLAALEAREAAAWAEDPAVALVLERIAADELRHAALGWRTLRWMLERGDASLRAFAFARLDAAIEAAAHARIDECASPALRAHGVLDDALRMQLGRRALERSLAPCVAALRRVYTDHEAQRQA